ncbi:VOC family protein [Citromicrobium bathyomarinum]|uniref:VOC family protein n=1 Tax=Citromicrobium sp. WPS32 TaxID=1634517 RepID=UPI0006C8E75E|nr:VOC family protein [Citromicrobium sp. WPS32]KPM15037.1 hypothetical protein WG75_09090 [Citromicrobium sp. WPS32]|tara:strand:+ start:14731 stop:15264 length:534 start_codon:yes stop_codon:yes gene_type:complete
MPKPGSLTALGPCEQLAYVPSDFDAALKYWTETMGVGPFFLFENITLENMRYRGEPTDARFSVAMAYWNDIQIELFRPENDAPAHYNGEYGVKDRLHHTLVIVEDFEAAKKAVGDAGAEIIVEGTFGGARVYYVDPGAGPGGLLEILEKSEQGEQLFTMMRDAARDWDGHEPLRTLG